MSTFRFSPRFHDVMETLPVDVREEWYTAAQLMEQRDQWLEAWLARATWVDPWVAYTPTVKLGATTVTIASNDSAYTQVGKTIQARIAFRYSNLNAGAGDLSITLPIPHRTPPTTFDLYTGMPLGKACLRDRSTLFAYWAQATYNTTADLKVFSFNSPAVYWTDVTPVALAAGAQGTGDEFYALIRYEAA